MKKNKGIFLLVVLLVTLLFSASATTLFAEDDEAIDTERNAFIYVRTYNNNLPVHYVQNSDIETYNYDGEETYDFRKYFHIIDQRKDVLKMKHLVDGEIAPIDLGGYVWDFSEFDITELGAQTVKISYEGLNGVVVSSSVTLTVIEEDVEAPIIYGLFGNVNVDVKADFLDSISSISAVDKVDGEIKLSIDNYSGYENIKGAPLNSTHEITLTITDKAGNSTERTFVATVKDLIAPIIYNAVNVETTVGSIIDYKAHIVVEDNYTPVDEIVKVFQIVTDESGDTLADSQTIDFNQTGETYVKIIATDEGGATSSRIYRVIVKDTLTLGKMILYINLSLVGAVIVTGGTLFAVKQIKKRK